MTALEAFRVDAERSCRSCGHPKWMECECSCCAADEEAEFAEILDALAMTSLGDGDAGAADYFWRATACGESDGTSVCVIRPGDHEPASNCPDGPVRHVADDGSAWIGPMGAAEAAMALAACGEAGQ